MQATVGVIGGSGLYEMEGLRDIEEVRLSTPFGEPSDAYVLVGVALPFNAPVKPLHIVFGKEDQLGFNSGLPVLLTDNQINWNFTQLLMPGEQLFAQIMDAAVAQQNVVVASAMF